VSCKVEVLEANPIKKSMVDFLVQRFEALAIKKLAFVEKLLENNYLKNI